MQLNRFFSFPLLASVFLLASCGSDHAPSGLYAQWLKKGEQVESSQQVGPFTILHIRYRPTGDGSLVGTGHRLDRILHGGKVIIDESQTTEPWEGTGAPAILSYAYAGDKSPLQLVYERQGKAVAERIDGGRIHWTVGQVMGPGLRYFETESSTQAGFLLKAFPLEVKPVPKGVERPQVAHLAGFAPDFRAFAFTDSLDAPSVVVVADAQGKLSDPIPMPAVPGATREINGDGTTGQIRPWFHSRFSWKKDATGRWHLVRTAAFTHGTAVSNPVEELFLDADMGYRKCFGNGAAACDKGWQKTPAASMPYLYKPVRAQQAFGAPVRGLMFASTVNGSAYHLILNAAPGQVMRELRARVGSRGLRHLGHEDISEQRLAAFVGAQFHGVHNLLPRKGEPHAQLLVLPTVALRVEPFEQGTIITTLARYPALDGAGAGT